MLTTKMTVQVGVSLLALSLSVPGLAMAQTAPSRGDPSTQLDEIVVTAQKREQNLIDVPLSVQAISGEQLERQGTRDLTQLVDFIPGASVVSKSAPGFDTIQIRGISAGTVGDSTTGYYIDDVVFSIPNLQISPPSRLFDLERTEILRGPQGTLYGNGAMGGLVRLITPEPDTNDFEARMLGELSSTEGGGTNYAADAVVNIPLASDVAGLRISGGYETLSGFAEAADRPGDKDLNDIESYNVRAKLLLRPTESVDVTLSAWHIDNHQNYNNGLVSVEPPLLANTFGTLPYNQVTADFYSASVVWDLGSASLQSGTSFIDHTLDFDTTLNTPAANLRAVADFHSESFSQELRLVSDSDGPLNWIVGGLYTDAKILSQFDYTIPFPAGPGTTLFLPLISQSPSPLTTESFALFGEASYEFMDGKLIPLIGLRYFEDERTGSGTTTLFPTFTPPGVALPSSGSGSFDALSPRFNLTYKPSDDATLYVNIAKGFRSGSVQTSGQVLFASVDGVATSTIIEPDELWSYELGSKFRTADRALSVDAAVYYTEWSNIQVPFTTSAGLVATLNGGDARVYGLDLGINYRTPIEGLSLQMVGNVNSAEFRNVAPALTARLPTASNGARLPGVPESNLSVSASYSAPLTGTLDLNLYGAYSYRASQLDLASGLESATLDHMTLRAGISSNRYRVDLFADNVLDDRGPLLASLAGQQAVYPRRIGIVLSVNY
jgi:outer membrane receptor protein involved in Fe transport